MGSTTCSHNNIHQVNLHHGSESFAYHNLAAVRLSKGILQIICASTMWVISAYNVPLPLACLPISSPQRQELSCLRRQWPGELPYGTVVVGTPKETRDQRVELEAACLAPWRTCSQLINTPEQHMKCQASAVCSLKQSIVAEAIAAHIELVRSSNWTNSLAFGTALNGTPETCSARHAANQHDPRPQASQLRRASAAESLPLKLRWLAT